MENLTFGEQVKIILSRKGMTIKELAETIETITGKKMSRQNLTQRLGRDNFQEQDMRMIAAILGCSFQLSIMTSAEDAIQASKIPAQLPTEAEIEKIENKKKMREEKHAQIRTQERSKGLKEFVLEEEPKKEEPKKEPPKQVYIVAGSPKQEKEPVAEERDMTIGEVFELHEELEELEEKQGEVQQEQLQEETPAIEEAEKATEPSEPVETEQEEELELDEAEAEDFDEDELEGEAFDVEAELADEPIVTKREIPERQPETKPEKKNFFNAHKRETKVPGDKDFEPVIAHTDLPEDLENGEVNPYTGKEYQTNSVRMHPNRIGYVQVYDRSDHKWTDMTEWAFLGYQERKKALLGKEYEPPIYLD